MNHKIIRADWNHISFRKALQLQ